MSRPSASASSHCRRQIIAISRVRQRGTGWRASTNRSAKARLLAAARLALAAPSFFSSRPAWSDHEHTKLARVCLLPDGFVFQVVWLNCRPIDTNTASTCSWPLCLFAASFSLGLRAPNYRPFDTKTTTHVSQSRSPCSPHRTPIASSCTTKKQQQQQNRPVLWCNRRDRPSAARRPRA